VTRIFEEFLCVATFEKGAFYTIDGLVGLLRKGLNIILLYAGT
jgi:hypothetical protein